jgi:hypothetical protein
MKPPKKQAKENFSDNLTLGLSYLLTEGKYSTIYAKMKKGNGFVTAILYVEKHHKLAEFLAGCPYCHYFRQLNHGGCAFCPIGKEFIDRIGQSDSNLSCTVPGHPWEDIANSYDHTTELAAVKRLLEYIRKTKPEINDNERAIFDSLQTKTVADAR